MPPPSDGSIIVPIDILRQADNLIRPGRAPSTDSANSIRQGVELLLRNNLVLSIDSDSSRTSQKLLPGQVDASALLNRGLNLLSNTPFETLDVAIGARTQEIRKAYKKMALKYHPDKNPLTTPLFQVIHAACEKLSDKEQRTKEESKVTARARQFGTAQQSTQLPPKPTNPTTYTKRTEGPPTNNPPYPSRYDPKGEQYQSNESKPTFPNAPRAGGGSQQQYDEMLKEQNKKADSDRRAKEFAARHASEAEAARRREVEHAQRAKYQEDLKANRDEMLRKAQREYSNYCRQSFDHPSMDDLKKNMPSVSAVNGSGSSKGNRSRQQSFESKFGSAFPTNDSRGNAKSSVSAHGDSKVGEGAYLNKQPSDNKNFQKPVTSQPQQQPQPVPAALHKPSLPIKVPIPFGLKCSSIGTTMVELEWQTSQNYPHALSVELSWKNRAMGLRVWESASKLISSGRCRKKNLVAGAVYEFRIRAVEELIGGMLGNRSEWAESILVTLLQPSNVSQEKPVEINTASDMAKPVAQASTRPPVPMPSFHFQRFPTHHEAVPPTSTAANTESTAAKASSRQPQRSTSDKGSRGMQNSGISSEMDGHTEAAKLDRKNSAECQKDVHEEVHEFLQQRDDKSKLKKTQSTFYMDKNLSASARQAWGIWGQQQQDGDSSGEKSTGAVQNETAAAPAPTGSSGAKSPFKRGKSIVKDIEEEDNSHEVDDYDDDAEESVSNSHDAESVDDDLDDENEVSSRVSSKCNENIKEVDEEEVAEEVINSGDESKSTRKANSVASSQSSNKKRRPGNERRGVTYKNTDTHFTQAKEPSAPIANTSNSKTKATAEKVVSNKSKADHDDYSDVFDIDDEEISDEEEEQWYQLKAPPTKNADGKDRKDTEYRHPVRAEPFSKSKVIGFLVIGVTVVATADCGDWLKVKIHTSSLGETDNQPVIVDSNSSQWGWCLRKFKNHEFLISANGIIIDDLNEAMKYKSHYSVENHKKDSSNKDDERIKRETKAKQLADSVSQGKENKRNAPAKVMIDMDHLSSSSHSPAAAASCFSPNSYSSQTPPPLARCNSIRLPPLDSPTKQLESFNVSTTSNNNKTNVKNVQKKSVKVDAVKKNQEIIVEVEEWSELKDESNHLYYYNAQTKQSKWEPPEWIQEWDPSSGLNYYLHYSDASGHKFSPKSLHSTWTKPEKFAKLKKYT